MSFIEHNGDVFNTDAEIIAHGVNVKSLMGSGFAKIVSDNYPSVEKSYMEACESGELVPGGVQVVQAEEDPHILIANVATQVNPGADARLELVEEGLENLFIYMRENDYSTVAMPRIGCGVGGLDWEDVSDILNEISDNYDDIHVKVWTL